MNTTTESEKNTSSPEVPQPKRKHTPAKKAKASLHGPPTGWLGQHRGAILGARAAAHNCLGAFVCYSKWCISFHQCAEPRSLWLLGVAELG